MAPRIEEAGRVLSLDDVRQLESALGVVLPRDYIDFLLKFNGGIPVPQAFDVQGFDLSPAGVQVFFGIDRPLETSNLAWNYNVTRGSLPPELLAIACDASGDIVYLTVAGKNKGEVVFWDYYGDPGPSGRGNIYPVAPSFTVFLEGLYDA